MAKFAIALCLLALVARGTQDSILSTMTNQVTSTLTSLASNAEEQQSTILDGMNSATSAVAAFEEQVNSTVQNLITENTAIVEGLIANATGDVSSCMAQSIDLQAIVLDYATNAITCAQNALDKLVYKCEATLNVFKNYIQILDNLVTNTTLCSANILTVAACMTLVWTSVQNELPNIWASLWSEVTVLSTDFANFGVSLGSCGSAAAFTTLINAAQKSQTELAQCITQLK